MTKEYSIALCALSPRDQRLLEIVINRPDFTKHRFKAVVSQQAIAPQVAIVDESSEVSKQTFAELKAQYPDLVTLHIIDGNTPPPNVRYYVPRLTLLVRVFHALNDLVDDGAIHSNKVVALPTAAPAPPPRPNAEQVAPQVEAFAEALPEIRPIRALVVDDSVTVREQLRAGLKRLGVEADVAEDATQAMLKLSGNTYDIALLDVVMPGLDGYDLCRTIKNDRTTRRMPVMMLTSRTSPFDRARGALAGCDAYLAKPITWEQFSKSVDKLLAKANQNDIQELKSRGYAGVSV